MGWSADVGRELTIQIRPLDGEVIDSNLRLAVSLSEAVPGVASARVVSIEESEELLQPWLGEGLDLSDLAIPRLVIVQLADPNAADISRLESEISAIPGRRWKRTRPGGCSLTQWPVRSLFRGYWCSR